MTLEILEGDVGLFGSCRLEAKTNDDNQKGNHHAFVLYHSSLITSVF